MKKEPAIKANPHDPHLTDEDIIGYIESNLAAREMDRMRKHLHACPNCFDAYQDAVLLRGMWTTDESAFEPSKELIDLAGRPVVGEAAMREEAPRAAHRRPVHSGVRRWGLVAACAAVVLIAAIWLLRPDEVAYRSNAVVSAAALRPVRNAVETASQWGPFVLPGSEHSLEAVGPAYRTGFVPLSDSLESSLRDLQQAFRDGDSSPDAAYWLIGGYIVTGQINAARDFMYHPRVIRMNDSRITILQAIIAYMDGRYEQAERLLREIPVDNPHYPVASVDLAVILYERGDKIESRAILGRIVREQAGTPLAQRAQSILSTYTEE